MAKRLRYIPPGGAVVEVTTRTIQGRYLLRPSPRLNELIVGVIGRAQERYSVRIHHFVVMSNHVHFLVSVADAEQLANFMEFVNGNLAREVGRLHLWRGPFWSRRYQTIVASDEEEAQLGRLRYLLAHGCKEGLVGSPLEWPGANATESLLTGQSLRGVWVDRTKQYWARLRGESAEDKSFETEVMLELAPLPCWAPLAAPTCQELVQMLVRTIEAETAAEHRRRGTRPAGRRLVFRQHPHRKPGRLSRSPAPAFHCVGTEIWLALRAAYRDFVDRFREAAVELRRGNLRARLPPGSFPPPLPFVRGIPDSS